MLRTADVVIVLVARSIAYSFELFKKMFSIRKSWRICRSNLGAFEYFRINYQLT